MHFPFLQRSAKVDAPGRVNAAGKLGRSDKLTAVIPFIKPVAQTLAELCIDQALRVSAKD